MIMWSKWQHMSGAFGGCTYLLRGEDFAVSYNPDLTATAGPLFAELFRADDRGPETALIKDDVFYILNGDFREQYERLVPQGWDACKQFYDQQSPQHESSWSTERKMSS